MGFCHSQSAVSNFLLPDLGRSRARQVGAAGGACEEGALGALGEQSLARVRPTSWAQLVHTSGTPDPSAQSAKFRRVELGTQHWAEASPAGPVTRTASANAAGASLRPGDISVGARQTRADAARPGCPARAVRQVPELTRLSPSQGSAPRRRDAAGSRRPPVLGLARLPGRGHRAAGRGVGVPKEVSRRQGFPPSSWKGPLVPRAER